MRFSTRRRLGRTLQALAFLAVSALAQQAMTVAKLTAFIRSAIQLKNPDKDVAAAVTKIKLTERFTLSDLGDLQDTGAGSKTVAALAALVTQSAGLPVPARAIITPKPAGPPEPSEG